jgi:hypothetical protein
MQKPIASVFVLIVLYVSCFLVCREDFPKGNYDVPFFTLTYFYCFSIYNTVSYIWSTWLTNKYGIEIFADLDQKWLQDHQGFDSKVFGEMFSRLIQCRKIAGYYMLTVIVPLTFINIWLSALVGVIYFVIYQIYKEIYLDNAMSYKIPRAFANSFESNGIISKIIDREFFDNFIQKNKKDRK